MSWKELNLGDLFNVGSSKRVLKSQWKRTGVPFYRGREVTRLAVHGKVDNELFISEEHFAELEKKHGVPKPDDIVITAIGTIGNSYVVKPGDRFYFKDASVLWLGKASGVGSEFVNYWLRSPLFKEQLDKGNGATVDTLTISKLKNAKILIPPLPEQKRIVTILDEAFEGIDKAVANTEKNLANARELFESYLSSVFSQRGDVWVERRLEEIASSTQIGLVRNRKEQGDSLEYSYVKMDNITPNNYFDSKNIVRVEANQSEVEKYSLKKGDLLFNTRNSYELVGKSCLYDIEKKEPVLFNNNIMRIRFVEEISPNFAAYLFHSPKVKKQLENMKSGTTNVSAIYYKSLKNIRLAFPSLDTQKTICGRLDEMSARAQELEAIYQQKLTALAELKQSLLQKAFSGELTAREAEAAVEEATA